MSQDAPSAPVAVTPEPGPFAAIANDVIIGLMAGPAVSL